MPCAAAFDDGGRTSLARRISGGGREDMNGSLTLLYGGHAEGVFGASGLLEVLSENLRRELAEDVGLGMARGERRGARPIGTVWDANNGIKASRHLAVVYAVFVGEERGRNIRTRSDEEFSRRSKRRGGCASVGEIEKLLRDPRNRLDPRSEIFFRNWVVGQREAD